MLKFFLLLLLLGLNETKVFKKCRVARLLYNQEMDGYHSYFLEDCFIDDDIRDDIDCLRDIIHYEGGLEAWDAWRNNCKGQDNSAWTKGCKIRRRRRALDK
ncbi:hypothetical protein lerEdw1_013184 [Lerista edwardsae]|nr:hypothetical protein lerEdw1_013184 [Lerista edwardsae]